MKPSLREVHRDTKGTYWYRVGAEDREAKGRPMLWVWLAEAGLSQGLWAVEVTVPGEKEKTWQAILDWIFCPGPQWSRVHL